MIHRFIAILLLVMNRAGNGGRTQRREQLLHDQCVPDLAS